MSLVLQLLLRHTRHDLLLKRKGGPSAAWHLTPFCTSAVRAFPKLKTHSGTKKRWTALPNGLFKRGKAGHKHLNVGKAPGRINRLGLTAYSHGAQSSTLRRLLPYG